MKNLKKCSGKISECDHVHAGVKISFGSAANVHTGGEDYFLGCGMAVCMLRIAFNTGGAEGEEEMKKRPHSCAAAKLLRTIEHISCEATDSHCEKAIGDIYRLTHWFNRPSCRKNHPDWGPKEKKSK